MPPDRRAASEASPRAQHLFSCSRESSGMKTLVLGRRCSAVEFVMRYLERRAH